MNKIVKETGKKRCLPLGKGGFSLVEIMVVLAIIAIMAAIAAPNFRDWRVGQNVRGAARNLYSAMQEAKVAAVRTNSNVNFVFSSGCGATGTYVFTSNVNNAAGNPIFQVRGSMPAGVCLTDNTNATPSTPPGVKPNSLPSGSLVSINIDAAAPNNNGRFRWQITQTSAGAFKLKRL